MCLQSMGKIIRNIIPPFHTTIFQNHLIGKADIVPGIIMRFNPLISFSGPVIQQIARIRSPAVQGHMDILKPNVADPAFLCSVYTDTVLCNPLHILNQNIMYLSDFCFRGAGNCGK